MKKNNDTPTLEQLLASVEHAGRDARRQQQLSEMIERMAAEEASKRHRSVRLWAVRRLQLSVKQSCRCLRWRLCGRRQKLLTIR